MVVAPGCNGFYRVRPVMPAGQQRLSLSGRSLPLMPTAGPGQNIGWRRRTLEWFSNMARDRASAITWARVTFGYGRAAEGISCITRAQA